MDKSIYTGSQSGQNIEDKPFEASRFELPKTIIGDRFIPMRTINECEELNENFECKIEIETRPPENLFEDGRLDAQVNQNNNQNNNQQNQNNTNAAQEMSSGENLRKLNILLQNTIFGIENPHMVQNGFLNENSMINMHSKNSPMNNNCVVQGLPGQDAIDESSHNYLQLLGTNQNLGNYPS